MIEIEEMIADAKAEEEVKKDNEFKQQLKEGLKDVLVPKDNNKVTIDLSEYVTLKNKEMDLDRLIGVIIDGLELSYNNDYLRLSNEGETSIVAAFKTLYSTAYDNVLAMELSHVKEEGE